MVWQRLYGHDGKGVPKLNVSDRVRNSKYKGTFEKGYETNWSEEVFTVHEVHPSEPPVYRLRDDLGGRHLLRTGAAESVGTGR